MANYVHLYRLGAPSSQDVHHKRGRIGQMLVNVDHWLAVSRRWHDWIHQNPREARQAGLLE